MIANSIQVSILDGGKPIKEIRRPGDVNKRYIEVVPGKAFTIKIAILNEFQFGRYRNADIAYTIDMRRAKEGISTRIVKPKEFKSGVKPQPWKASSGRFNTTGDPNCYINFAFGRDMESMLIYLNYYGRPADNYHSQSWLRQGV